ncbi:dihydrolipoamide acetyltransferase family protein [Oscillibacter sp.]|uniref:dihydrolipoamide acetyltransferase family protein n=2 Tax=Oscillibacter TaxID=459786 RepID=UPI002D810390|nr:dihydrolipoamide acetyltransferase family protein [Oscillibacter sp.]MBS6353836.1 2-oxo acid dehydrogenase subunit E2 [Oscillibacter sp.]
MAYEVLMPQLGLTMEEGTVSQWIKHEGDAVKAGDVVVEITTDKLTNEITSEQDGVLLKIVAQEGEDVPVKGLLAYIGQPGEQVGGTAPAAAAASAAPSAEPAAASVSAPAAAPAAGGKRIRISPLARKIARQMGVDYTAVTGTGPSGRIVKRDILAAAEAAPKAAAPAPAARKSAAPAAVSGTAFPVKNLELMEGDTVEKLTGMRKVVAQRMYTSAVEIPTVTQTVKVDVTALLAFRKKLKEEGHAFSVNDFVLKAVAKALRRHPEILVSLDGEQIIRRAHVNLGMAVALDAGLIVPVIRDADLLSLEALSAKAKDLAERARANQLGADEYKGSTFTVSNLGMFGVESFTPIINQPDAAILGVNCTEDELVMEDDGTIAKHQVLRISLTFDHRLLDGAVAAKFEMTVRDLLEHPMDILL